MSLSDVDVMKATNHAFIDCQIVNIQKKRISKTWYNPHFTCCTTNSLSEQWPSEAEKQRSQGGEHNARAITNRQMNRRTGTPNAIGTTSEIIPQSKRKYNSRVD